MTRFEIDDDADLWVDDDEGVAVLSESEALELYDYLDGRVVTDRTLVTDTEVDD